MTTAMSQPHWIEYSIFIALDEPGKETSGEDLSENTKDNFRNTAQIIDPDKPVVLISSDYHMDRAVQTAEAAGFSDILRLPAPSSFINYGANVLSEVILELVELMPGQ
jgi:uncharacterized SAM-binding protein YcdF (DUF218 family)